MKINGISALALAAALVALPNFAHAQDVAEAPAEDNAGAGSGIEDIVVTAQRRTESLQNVPIAVTAITASDIAKQGATNTLDVASVSPGLQMNLQRSTVTPYLRGVGTQNGGVGEEGSIATYVDGVYITALSAANFAFNNIARIEVLKGPQGTLFGRNATGGLLHVITKDPSHTTMLDVNVGYANYDTWTASAYGTTGLTDTIAIDLSGFFTEQGKGWGKNVSGIVGVDGTDVNYRDEWAVRSKLMIEATDDLTIRIAGDYSHREADLGNTRSVLPGAKVTGGFGLVGSIFDSQSNLLRDTKADQWGASLTVDYDLGGPTLTSTSAYRSVKNYTLFDQDGGPLAVINAPITERTKSFQQEFLLVGDAGSLDYTAGLFFFYSDARFDPLGLRSAIIPSQNLDRFSKMTTYSYASFVQGTYHFSDATGLTAGLRYTRDEREIEGVDISSVTGAVLQSTAINPTPDKANYEKLTWRAALDHKVTDHVLVFASASRGFKSGIYNLTNPYQAPVRPETLDAYEVGIKSDLLDRQLRFNLSGFWYDYKDIQLSRIEGGVTQLLNAASARIYGLDLELIAAPPVAEGNLQFRAAFSYLNGEYRDFDGAPITVRNPNGGNITTPGNASGNRVIKTPPYTLNLSADYTHPVGDAMNLGLNVSYYYNSGFYWEPDNRVKQANYNLLNMSLNLSGEDDRWRVSAFVRNLTDERYYVSVSTSSLGDQGSAGAPRTYGISLGYKFGG